MTSLICYHHRGLYIILSCPVRVNFSKGHPTGSWF